MSTVDRIFRIMRENNLSAKEFAQKVGVSQGNITDWKTGRANPSVPSLQKIANCFNISLDFLLGNTNKESIEKTLITYLRPLELTDKDFDVLKNFGIAFFNNESKEIMGTIMQEAKNKSKVLEGFKILADVADSIENSSKINKARYILRKKDIDEEPTDINSLEYALEKMEPSEIVKNTISNALINLDKSKIVQQNPKKLCHVPILGKIAAGQPLLAEEYIEGYLPVDPNIYGVSTAEDLFFLRIAGNSMNLKVKNGDYALIRKQDYAEDGDIIAVIVNSDGEATLKRYKKLNDQFVLLEPMSTDPTIESITVDLKTTKFQIIGKAIGQFGKF